MIATQLKTPASAACLLARARLSLAVGACAMAAVSGWQTYWALKAAWRASPIVRDHGLIHAISLEELHVQALFYGELFFGFLAAATMAALVVVARARPPIAILVGLAAVVLDVLLSFTADRLTLFHSMNALDRLGPLVELAVKALVGLLLLWGGKAARDLQCQRRRT